MNAAVLRFAFLIVLLLVFSPDFVFAQQGTLQKVAGTGFVFAGDNGPATNVPIGAPQGVAVDAQGNVYVADYGNSVVEKITPSGYLTIVAGRAGRYGFVGDGGAAIQASLMSPSDVAVDQAGNLYIADLWNYRVRKVDTSGIITTIAGNGSSTSAGDNGPATSASFRPYGLGVDTLGTKLYIADRYGYVIRMVDLTSGIITTVAGGGSAVNYGGAATATKLYGPSRAVPGRSGEFYIADTYQILKVASGIVTAVVPYATSCSFADNVPAASSTVCFAWGLAVDSQNQLYIGDSLHERIRKIDTSGYITTIAGNGTVGRSGDGGAATLAKLNFPQSPAVDTSGNVYIADQYNSRIRKVANGIITNFAGNGGYGFGGDGGPATQAYLRPWQLAFTPAHELLVADIDNSRIRKIGVSGVISTIAGTGTPALGGDGGPATAADLNHPRGLAADGSGNIFIGDAANNCIRKINANGTISTLLSGYIGSSQLSFANSKLYFPFASTVKSADAVTAALTTLAGTGTDGYGPDGVAATLSKISYSTVAVLADSGGNIYIADAGNNRIRKVNSSGIITTIAGTGTAGFSGDGGPATAAQISQPTGMALDSHGNLFFVDTSNKRIRVITPFGLIATAAGTGVSGFVSDSGPALLAQFGFLNNEGILLSDWTTGDLYFVDPGYDRFGKIIGASSPGFVLGISAAQTIDIGTSAAYTVTVVPLSGWTGSVNLSCTNLAGISCSFTPPSVSITNTSAATSTMTLSTTAAARSGTNIVRVSGAAGALSITAGTSVVVNLLAPTISSLSPIGGATGAAGLTLTVNGSGFASGSVVRWNGGSRTTTFISTTQLTAAITATDLAAGGTAQISVYNPAPGGGTAGPVPFIMRPMYAVGDVHPNSGDDSGMFSDNSINTMDLIAALRAVVNLGNHRPPACSDRFDAMDAFPADSASRGGDGMLNNLDLVLTLRRITNIDTARPMRCSRLVLPCPAPPGAHEASMTRRITPAAGALEFWEPQVSRGRDGLMAIYLRAFRDLELSGLSVGIAGPAAALKFYPAAGQAPSLLDSTVPGELAIAWLDRLRADSGARVLLGYVPAPLAQAQKLNFSAIVANDSTGAEITITAPSPKDGDRTPRDRD